MSIIKERYYRGVNLGGWMSQCDEYSQKHYSEFITEKDIKQISELGFDHVRIPFDYHLILSETYDKYLDEGMEHIKRALSWCKKYNLNVMLDLHKTPGYSFDTKEDNILFSDPKLQDIAVDIWRMLAKTFKGVYGDEVVFELLNEVVEPDSTRWNKLLTKMIEAIQEVDKDRYIMIGGNNYNACDELKNLPLFNDEKILYTFHFYLPILFTHQKAYWHSRAMQYNQTLEYPGEYTNLDEFLKKFPEHSDISYLIEEGINKEAVRKYMEPAFEFTKKHNKPLYCGEYGVIALAPLESRIKWHEDTIELFDEYEIGACCWTYKEKDFDLIDKDGKPVSKKFMDVISGNKS